MYGSKKQKIKGHKGNLRTLLKFYFDELFILKGDKMKKIPVGIEDFKEIINNNCYYIDKTKFIANILDDGSKVKLFI